MQKVIIIDLNGRACQLNERAYEALRAYLDGAEAQLAANPDKAEIISDLEQAIAEKCDRFLGVGKNVVTSEEIAQVIEEMGPVHDSGAQEGAAPHASDAGAKEAPRPDSAAPRRLYRIREGSMIAGVCTGLAAFFNIDVTVLRLILVLLAVVTSGGLILVYVIAMFVIPAASTSEERAAAHGMPFNAQELIDRVKTSARFSDGKPWFDGKWPWDGASARRHRRRAHRQQLRAQRRAWADSSASGMDYAGQVMAGVFIPIASIISAALFVGLALAIISLLADGAILGWRPPESMPLWAQIAVLVIFYHLIAWPLHLVSHGPYYGRGGPAHGWISMWGGILWVGFTALFMWLAYQHFPGVKEFIDNLPDSLPHRIGDGVNVLVRLLR